MSHQWFKSPDLVAGWKTAQENQSNNMLESAVGNSGGLPGDFSISDFSSGDFWVEVLPVLLSYSTPKLMMDGLRIQSTIR